MFKLSSRSATVLVIFSVACIAFCLATVFASMTGPISILPNESNSGSVLDNLSVLTDSDNHNYQSYGYDDSKSDSQSSEDSHSDEPKVETTTESSTQQSSSSSSSTTQQSSSTTQQSSSSSSPSQVETTVDQGSSSPSQVETTRG